MRECTRRQHHAPRARAGPGLALPAGAACRCRRRRLLRVSARRVPALRVPCPQLGSLRSLELNPLLRRDPDRLEGAFRSRISVPCSLNSDLNLPFSSLPSLGPLPLPVPLPGGCQTPTQAWSSACAGDPGLTPLVRPCPRGSKRRSRAPMLPSDPFSVPSLSPSRARPSYTLCLFLYPSFSPCRAGIWTPGWVEGLVGRGGEETESFADPKAREILGPRGTLVGGIKN